ncbi:ATP-binding cassette domain-containing protein [Escherichia coli]|uniref:cysteine peptidase family C39 domain-containing protein n=1 Tax=Escherichia coli TaxID=562 RepID=UPI000BE3B3C6|nr:cysteine peptidase family C39 domain-containing protein [Escherichia coli]EFI5569988.1 ATP-binding cassette domain-containing protein [Escherichia coli]
MKKIPDIVYQDEINECGLACIAMFLEAIDIDISITELRESYGPFDNGTSLYEIMEILKNYNVNGIPILFSPDELTAISLPAILHYNESHYVVLVERRGSYFVVMDPAMGMQVLHQESLTNAISGYAIIAAEKKEQNLKKNKNKNKNSKKKKKLQIIDLNIVKKIKKLIFVSLFLSLSVFFIPVFTSSVINNAFLYRDTITATELFIFICGFLMSSITSIYFVKFKEKYAKQYALEVDSVGFNSLLRKELSFFEKRSYGDIFTRYVEWLDVQRQKVNIELQKITEFFIIAVSFSVMLSISPFLSFISAVCAIIMIFISVFSFIRDKMFTQEVQQRLSRMNDFLMETISGYQTIRVGCLSEERQIRFASLNKQYQDVKYRNLVWEQTKNTAYSFVSTSENVIFIIISLQMYHNSSIKLGEVFAFLFIKGIFSSSSLQLLNCFLQDYKNRTIEKRAEPLFCLSNQKTDDVDFLFHQNGCDPLLSLVNVGFSYDNRKYMLYDVTLSISEGSIIALRGCSGQGKSTLLKILAGLIKRSHGDVFLNYKKELNISKIVYLQTQYDKIFYGSVIDNLTLFRKDVSNDDVNMINHVLKLLELYDIINSMSGGINAIISDNNSTLSSGQKHRLFIARALLSSRPVLLMDEPTANLDDEMAYRVMASIINFCQEQHKTLLVVTHSAKIESQFKHVIELNDGKLTLIRGMEK